MSLKTHLFLKLASQVHFQTTPSELEALILESRLINIFKPRYNARLKDDKSPLYIAFTNEPYPRILALRQPQIIGNWKLKIENYFGPFPSGYQLHRLLGSLRRIFPFCTTGYKSPRPCLYYHLGLCPGACTGRISPKDYQTSLQPLKLILSGKIGLAQTHLHRLMRHYAQSQQFESAAQIRDQISQLNQLTTRSLTDSESPVSTQFNHRRSLTLVRHYLSHHFPKLPHPLNRIEGYDVSNLQGQQAAASLVVFTHGQKDSSQYRRFKIRTNPAAAGPDDPSMLKQALTRRFHHPEWGIPDLILVDGGIPQLHSALSVVGHRLPVIALAKRQEIIFTPRGSIKLSPQSPALHLLQAIRDEAHRFAHSYHLKLRDTIK